MKVTPPYHLLHIIADLDIGGAETVLYHLASQLEGHEFNSSVVALSGEGPIGKKLRESGIPVTCLGFRPGIPDPRLIARLAAVIRSRQPALIQTWMYHANLAGGLAARLVSSAPVVWNIRHANYQHVKPLTRAVVGLNALFSHFIPKKIICCAEAACVSHIRMGFARKKMLSIPNGFNIDFFYPQSEARQSVRRELELEDNAFIIGLGARFAPEKDHLNFIRAAAILARQVKDVYFVLWGKDIDSDNHTLNHWIKISGTSSQFRLLGVRFDTPRLLASLDVFSLSSASEAFPNSVGEAMACGIPCVVTNVGDSALLVGETGLVVPPHNPHALAEAWARIHAMTAEERAALGRAARRRIEAHFGLPAMVAAYAGVYRNIIGQCLQNNII